MEPIRANPKEMSVAIGFPCGPMVPWQCAFALAGTTGYCIEKGIDINVLGVAGSSVVTWARSKVVDRFLKTDAKYLFWIDSDIVWRPMDFVRVLALATKYDVVCGVYAQKNDSQNIVIRRESLEEFEVNEHGLLHVNGAGLGFTCLRREIVEHLASTKPWVWDAVDKSKMRDVFRIDTVDLGNECPDQRHEDMAFFADVIELGYDVWLDPTVKLGHVGPKVYECDPLAALRLTEAYEEAAV